MNQPNSFSGNKWWLQADSGHRERMTSVVPNTNFSPSSSPVVQKGLPRKPDPLGLEGREGCEIVSENKGEVPLDERYGRSRWYLAEEKELALMIADRQSEPLQNCDLPTPYQRRSLKNSLEGERNKPVAPTKSVSSDYDYSLLQSIGGRITETSECTTEHPDKKLDLLKALQLSQTRARVAERKASIMSMENENLLNLYFKGSARIFAYRQWVKLLELEILQLQSQGAVSQSNGSSDCSEMSSDINGKKNQVDNYSNRAWYWAVTLCLSLASVGVVLTWRRGWRLSGLRGDELPRLGVRLYPSAGFVRV
ncbi:uncharacterized protein LOC116259678 [Nymphaea colorata]|nr:uncharacterized protein LOC116259678 [Nymphaea colorata]